MANSFIKYYPVGNGDQSLISVDENYYVTNILVDCRIREACLGTTNEDQYDVKADLLKTLKTRIVNGVNNVSYVDIFILSHGDDDHLHGFEANFYQGDPKNYAKQNLNKGEIMIDVLWFSPMVMGTAQNDDERCFNKEAKRRIKLHQDNSPDKDIAGNRIVVIGYDANEKLSGLDLVRKVPGQEITRFNNRDLYTFSIFIHSPYQQHLTDEEVDRNRVSVVFQARFKANIFTSDFCTLAMFGGDANYEAWKTIIEKTKKYGNDIKQKALNWDLFLAPHHCSWSFFNEHSEDSPAPAPLAALDYKRANAKVIGSCREVCEATPPHQEAIDEYIKKVGKANFIPLATYKKQGKTPQPVIFEITTQGPMPPKQQEGTALIAGGAGLSAVNSPSTYGSI